MDKEWGNQMVECLNGLFQLLEFANGGEKAPVKKWEKAVKKWETSGNNPLLKPLGLALVEFLNSGSAFLKEIDALSGMERDQAKRKFITEYLATGGFVKAKAILLAAGRAN